MEYAGGMGQRLNSAKEKDVHIMLSREEYASNMGQSLRSNYVLRKDAQILL